MFSKVKTHFDKIEMMRVILTVLFCSLVSATQGQRLKIMVDTVNSTCFDKKHYETSRYRKNIDSAFIIMNAVFNSPDFQTAIAKAHFPCVNRYGARCHQDSAAISDKEVLDSLFKRPEVSMAIRLKRRCRKKLGKTGYNKYKTTACLKNIQGNMPKLPLSYALAVNLCHEYMHFIGFYHSSFAVTDIDDDRPNPDGYTNDIAYRVGWDTYWLLKKWYEQHQPVAGL